MNIIGHWIEKFPIKLVSCYWKFIKMPKFGHNNSYKLWVALNEEIYVSPNF
jgi:hypothetical protein